MIDERQNSAKEPHHDVFSNLLAANDENLDITALPNSEIIGVFNFFFWK